MPKIWTPALAFGVFAAFLVGCADETPTAPATATVQFSFVAAPAVPAPHDYPYGCIRGVIRTHVSVSWKEPRIYMEPLSDSRFEATVAGAPIGREISVAISDPNACFHNAEGRATSGVSANGVRLTRWVTTGDEGARFLFRIAADGTVIP
ncbi:MAG TPA: hypothetical protein VGS22_20780 [Thermoanaerobaculia bacterium]|jgi:hypothetical protein|nr:hypothetical protein [Thermoanaerobaculia bacterium]